MKQVYRTKKRLAKNMTPEEIEEKELIEWGERMVKFVNVKSNSPMTLEEIATVLGCTREYVRQIEVNALRQLKKELIKRGIESFRDISAENNRPNMPYLTTPKRKNAYE